MLRLYIAADIDYLITQVIFDGNYILWPYDKGPAKTFVADYTQDFPLSPYELKQAGL